MGCAVLPHEHQLLLPPLPRKSYSQGAPWCRSCREPSGRRVVLGASLSCSFGAGSAGAVGCVQEQGDSVMLTPDRSH